jgi:hypothetical protein
MPAGDVVLLVIDNALCQITARRLRWHQCLSRAAPSVSRCSDRARSPHARLDLEASHLPRLRRLPPSPPRCAGR